MGKVSKNLSRRQAELEKYEGDYIIPVMGPTGAGKSSFINEVLGDEVVKVGHGLSSCTVDMTPIEVPANLVQQRIPGWKRANKVIIVDTPGFEDTFDEDSEILKRIAEWLVDSYGLGAKVAGLIYLEDICQRRVTTAQIRNFAVFEKLCGKNAYSSVVLATTQWARVPANETQLAVAREKELQLKFWNSMIDKGSRMVRVTAQDTAWDLVEMVLCRDMIDGRGDMIRIQEEMLKLKKTLPQTEAAAVLRKRIEGLVKSLKSGGATKADVRAIALQVEELKVPSLMGWFRKKFL